MHLDDEPLPDLRGPQRELIIGVVVGVAISFLIWMQYPEGRPGDYNAPTPQFSGLPHLVMALSLGIAAGVAGHRRRLVWERIAPLSVFLGGLVGFAHRMAELTMAESMHVEPWDFEGRAKFFVFVVMLMYGIATLIGGAIGVSSAPHEE